MHRISKQLSAVVLALCSLALTACFSSDKPLIDAKTRVVPFTTPITLEVYERKDANDPWQKQRDLITLVADNQRVVRLSNEEVGDTYVFHPLESGRFMLEAHSKSNGRFSYGVLEVRDGEGLLHHLDCESIDQAAFAESGRRRDRILLQGVQA